MGTPKTGKKLLTARLGVGALTFVACAAFPGCNLVAPPPCRDGGDPDTYCRPQYRPDAGTDAATDGGAGPRDAATEAQDAATEAQDAAVDAALDADLTDAGNG